MISLYDRVVIVANRRRVRQCHAADAALLWMMGRREAGLLVIMRRLHLRYTVTRGFVCATKPSSPPRVTLTLHRPFRTILQKRDCLLHVRYRDGARVVRYPCLSMFDAFRAFGKQNRPFAFASRPKSYRSRPPPYPLLWFGLRTYDTYRENARPPSTRHSRPAVAGVAVVLPELPQKPQQ